MDRNALKSYLGSQAAQIRELKRTVEEITALVRAAHETPKHVEDIPGPRVPMFGVVEITVPANSTSRLEGTHNVSSDGPFVVTGLALFWQRTSGAYTGYWGPAQLADAEIALAGQNFGVGGIFNKPHAASFNVEIEVSDSGRQWQNLPFASGLFSEATGYAYVLPVAHMLGTNAVVKVHVTPTVAQAVSGTVQALLLGYKIVHGPVYQP